MDINAVKNFIGNLKKGAYYHLTYHKDMEGDLNKVGRANGDKVEKTTSTNARLGIAYDNQKSVIEKRANGELPSENQGLPWGQWLDGYEGYLITHKDKIYLRVYFGGLNKTEYIVNGLKKTKAELKAMGIIKDSYFAPNSSDCYVVDINNIVAIGSK